MVKIKTAMDRYVIYRKDPCSHNDTACKSGRCAQCKGTGSVLTEVPFGEAWKEMTSGMSMQADESNRMNANA